MTDKKLVSPSSKKLFLAAQLPTRDKTKASFDDRDTNSSLTLPQNLSSPQKYYFITFFIQSLPLFIVNRASPIKIEVIDNKENTIRPPEDLGK